MTNKAYVMLALSLLLSACGPNSPSNVNSTGKVSGEGWLLGAKDDQQRMERLHQYLAGFSKAMWETGYRFEATQAAIADNNLPLADYHWGKVRSAVENGYLKRPGRQANADQLFLDAGWQTLNQALNAPDEHDVKQAFVTARDACMACHVAEDVAFMNDQPLFRQARFD